MFKNGMRVIMCNSLSYCGFGTLNGMSLRARVWAELAERDDIRGWDAGKTILTSRSHKVELGPVYAKVYTNNNVYVCPTEAYIETEEYCEEIKAQLGADLGLEE